jgi:PHP family Zn ribbon phosphoesterase
LPCKTSWILEKEINKMEVNKTMTRTAICPKCGKRIDKRGMKRHMEFCDGRQGTHFPEHGKNYTFSE